MANGNYTLVARRNPGRRKVKTMIEITMRNYAAFSGKATSTYENVFDCTADAAEWFADSCGLARPVRVTVGGSVVAEGTEACLVYLQVLSSVWAAAAKAAGGTL